MPCHYPIKTETGTVVYLCNQAVMVSPNKITGIKKYVTCKNCLKQLQDNTKGDGKK